MLAVVYCWLTLTLTIIFYHYLPDDIYAYALSKALTRVSAPATLGLYSTCQNRITRILKKIQGMSPSKMSAVSPEAKLRTVHPSRVLARRSRHRPKVFNV